MSVPFAVNISVTIPHSRQEPLNRARIKRFERAQDGAEQDPLEKGEHLPATRGAKQHSLMFEGEGKFGKFKLAPQPANLRGAYRDGPPAATGQGQSKEGSSTSWPTGWQDWKYDQLFVSRN